MVKNLTGDFLLKPKVTKKQINVELILVITFLWLIFPMKVIHRFLDNVVIGRSPTAS